MNPIHKCIKWLWRKIRRPKKDDRIVAIKDKGETIAIVATKEAVREYLPKKTPDVTKTLDEIIEDQERKRWLPTPTTRRRTRTTTKRPPAAEHGDAIARAMKGKGKGHHPTYRRTTKAHVSPEEPEDD